VRDVTLLIGSLLLVVVGLRSAAPSPPPAASAIAAHQPPASVSAAAPAGATPSSAVPSTHLIDASCTFDDRGLGDYLKERTQGIDVLARAPALAPDGSYDLLLHFHGGAAVGRIVAPLGLPLVIASIDRGDSSGDYADTIRDRRAWDELLAAVDAAVTKTTGRPARARRIALSSFSAGFEATRQALLVAGRDESLTGVIMLDSLYGSYAGDARTIVGDALLPFESAARRALDKPRFTFLLTHSEVATHGYASTGEVATWLIEQLSVRSSLVNGTGARGLRRVAEERGFALRGYGGSDKGAHCAHLALLPELIEIWRSRL
jgi:hypothetical protein